MELSRRAFLRGSIGAKAPYPLRPPWALAERDFTNTCTRCGDCVTVCPSKIIVIGGADLIGDHDLTIQAARATTLRLE